MEQKFHLVHEKKIRVVKKFHLVHEKKFRVVKNFKIVKRSCSLNRYYRVLSKCQIKWVITLNFCGLLRKAELYQEKQNFSSSKTVKNKLFLQNIVSEWKPFQTQCVQSTCLITGNLKLFCTVAFTILLEKNHEIIYYYWL